MKWFILVVGLVVVCFVAALLLGLVRGGGMGSPTSSMRHDPLPDEPLTDADLDGLAFDVTARGYRMGEVDAVIDRLRRELREKDEQIAVLRGDVQRAVTAEPAAPPDRAPAEAPTESRTTGEPLESTQAPERRAT